MNLLGQIKLSAPNSNDLFTFFKCRIYSLSMSLIKNVGEFFMRLLYEKNVFVLFSVLLFIAAMLYGFDQPRWISDTENMAQAFMDEEDTNGDGIVTKEEFKGPEDQFASFDKNGDGIIELSEAPESKADLMNGNDDMKEIKREVLINGIAFDVSCEIFTWSELPDDVIYERQPVVSFTNNAGETHYYEAVYVKSGNLNWYEAAYLADDAGGYLASIGSEAENSFVFNLVSDPKYFWSFPDNGEHYGISIGPFLGGYQPEGSIEPAGGWCWLSGETWDYTNWAKNLDDGVIDKDPRPSDQPNNSGEGQPIMGFGEMNVPVPTWGDYMENVGTYGKTRLPGLSYGFVIEYEKQP